MRRNRQNGMGIFKGTGHHLDSKQNSMRNGTLASRYPAWDSDRGSGRAAGRIAVYRYGMCTCSCRALAADTGEAVEMCVHPAAVLCMCACQRISGTITDRETDGHLSGSYFACHLYRNKNIWPVRGYSGSIFLFDHSGNLS